MSTGKRFLHAIIDDLLFQIFFFGSFWAIDQVYSGLFRSYFDLQGFFALYLLYYAGFEFAFQKTLGKFITKTVVIDEYANKPELSMIILRTLIRLVPFEALSCLGDKYSYGWHDKWSKTWVVTEAELAALKRLQHENLEIPTWQFLNAIHFRGILLDRMFRQHHNLSQMIGVML